MAKYPAMLLWTDAYLADTTHLSTEEHGAYMLLLIAAWRSPGCCLPDDDDLLARFCHAPINRWRLRLRPVLERFFRVEDGVWTQKRLMAERKHVEGVSQKRREASEKSRTGNPLKPNGSDLANAGANDPANDPLSSNYNSKERKKDSSPSAPPLESKSAPPGLEDDDDHGRCAAVSHRTLVKVSQRIATPLPAVAERVELMIRIRGSAPAVEAMLLDALARDARNPLAYVNRCISNFEADKAGKVARALEPEKDPFLSAVSKLLQEERNGEIEQSAVIEGTCDSATDAAAVGGEVGTKDGGSGAGEHCSDGRRISALFASIVNRRLPSMGTAEVELAEPVATAIVH